MEKTRYVLNFLVCAFSFLVLFCGCMSSVRRAHIGEVQTVSGECKAEPVQLTKVIIKLKRGQKIGTLHGGVFCVHQGNMTWQGGRMNVTSDDFTDVFREEFENAGFEVVGNPEALFDDPSEWKKKYLIGGLINELESNICYPMSGFGDFNTAKGSAFLRVNWQVYSALERKVVYQVDTEGSFETTQSEPGGDINVLINAFGVATQNLLANRDFYDLVTHSKESEKAPSYTRLSLNRKQAFSSSINDHINDVRAAVVTIFTPKGHGSGFFISNEGYLLTNQHVVGDAQTVKVKLTTGREILGEVIRFDRPRDVAVVKAEESGMIALPIRDSEPGVGEEVA